MTISPATACCKVSARYLKPTVVYPLSTCSMPARPSTSGIVPLVKPTSFPKPRGVSKGIRSCPLCSPSVNDQPSAPYKTSLYPTSLCSPSSTTYTLWCHPTGSAQSTTFSPTRSKAKPASNSTAAKPVCGTQLARHSTTKHSGTRRRRVGGQSKLAGNVPGTHRLGSTHRLHQHLLDRIPHLEDLQASWLLLLFCASPRCTYLLRMCPPHITAEFANNHDFAIVACLRRLLEVDELPAPALAIAHLPLSHGGLGLTCAATLANPAFWSSWADSLPVLQTQLPQYAAQILQHLQHPSPAIPSIQAAAGAAQALQEHGWTPPNWVELAQGNRPNPADTDPEENAPRTPGWQQQATTPGPHGHVQ